MLIFKYDLPMISDGAAILAHHEGFRLKIYNDATGKPIELPKGENPTVGIGVNLADGLTYTEAHLLFESRIADILRMFSLYPWFNNLHEVRKWVCINMAYCLGMTRFRKFERTINALQRKDYLDAAKEILDSDFARDERHATRANQLAQAMKTGQWDLSLLSR